MSKIFAGTALLIVVLALGGCDRESPTESSHAGQLAAARAPVYGWDTVSGFTNPRGLAFGPDGLLYVAEAGTGGTLTTAGQCDQEPAPVGPFTGGFTARISRISPAGERETLADGLPSAAGPDGTAIGVSALAFLGEELYALVSGGGCSRGHLTAPSGIYHVTAADWALAADFTPFYRLHPAATPDLPSFSPDGSLFALAAAKGRLVFTESNQKGLFAWSPKAGFSRVADFSTVAGLEVPTAISAHGPILVSDFGVLRGPLIGDGTESVYKVTPSGHTQRWAGGFSKILGLAVHKGNLYVLEAASGGVFAPGTGRVVRVGGRGRGQELEVVVSGLYFPTAMVAGPDGALYVSNRGFGAAPGTGEVLRIEP